MPDDPDRKEDRDRLVDSLLALPDSGQRAEFLRRHDLLDAAGLDALLDDADALLNRDPGRARELAELCMELAGTADAPAATPKANYVIAGAYDLNGDFVKALELTRSAYDGYIELGMESEALRTEVGKMSALLDLDRYQEVLRVGHGLISDADALDCLSDADRDYLAALAHMNLGICFEYLGSYTDALAAYARSEDRFVRLGLLERLSEVKSNRGIMLMNLGRVSEALTVFEEASSLLLREGKTVSYAATRLNSGYAHVQLGNYAQGIRVFHEVQETLETMEPSFGGYRLLLDMADAYIYLNLYEEAFALYSEAYDLLKDTGPAHDRALASWGLGRAHSARGELQKSSEAFEEATRILNAAGNIPLLVNVMLEQAWLVSLSGEASSALQVSEDALALALQTREWPIQVLQSHMSTANLALPDTEKAAFHLREARNLVEAISVRQFNYKINEIHARICYVQKRYAESTRLYKKAIDEIEDLRGAILNDSIRATFLKDKTSIYGGLLEVTLDNLDEGSGASILEALEVAEQSKSRALADLLSGIVVRTWTSVEKPELAVQLETHQADLNALYSRLLGHGAASVVERSDLLDQQKRALELEGEMSRLRLRLDASALDSSDPFKAPRMQTSLADRLSPDTVMLTYHVLDDEILSFIVSAGEVRAKRGVGSVAKVRELLRKLDSQWDRFRAERFFSEKQMEMLEKSTRRVLATLYDEIVGPVESLVEEAVERTAPSDGQVPKLVIVPHGPLHQAPFHAFFDGERYLMDRFEISYAPSATVFALCQEKKSRPLDRAVTVGVSDELILTAEDEASAVAGLFPESEILLDERATSKALEEAVAGCGALHVACHGMFRSDNPMFSALKLHEDWLLAYDAMGLNLDGAIVVLSACESGRNVVVGGDEILGLTRAFLGAGAATLLVSLWIVHDDTTPDLMSRFYERLISGVPPARALRSAQLETREKHPHPYYWAPFVTVGKR